MDDATLYDEVSEQPDYVTTVDARMQYLQLKTASNIVVPQWNTSTIYGLVAAMVAAIVAGVWYECLDDYAKHLYYRMLNRQRGSHCYGDDKFSCLEKFVQAVLLVVRLALGYFMMMCAMTFNLWLLVSVVLGAAIGYGIGKPIITGVLKHPYAFYTHGFNVAKVTTPSLKDRRAAQRSRSWRYQPINRQIADTSFREELDDSFSDDQTNFVPQHTTDRDSADIKVVWVKRTSQMEPDSSDSRLHSDDDDIVFREKPKTGITTESPKSFSRFKPASREINRSFRSTSQDKPPYRSTIHDQASYRNISHDVDQPSTSRVTRSASRASTTSTTSVKSASRFKSVSKVISDERVKFGH